MERSLAGVLFLVAAVAFSLSAGGWWMQRIAFTPDEATDTTAAILEAPDIRLELNTVITGAAAPTLDQPATELSSMLENVVLSTRAGATVMIPLISQAHDRIIGLRDDEPIQLTGTELIPIVRDQRAADVSTLTLPIQPIGRGTIAVTRSTLVRSNVNWGGSPAGCSKRPSVRPCGGIWIIKSG